MRSFLWSTLLLIGLALAQPPQERVQLTILTDPPGARIVPEYHGQVAGATPASVGVSNGPPVALRVSPSQSSLTVSLEHPLCLPRRVTIPLQPYRAYLADTYPEKGMVALQYRSTWHALVGHIRPWMVPVLAVLAAVLLLTWRKWRAAQSMQRRAELDTELAREVLERIVPAAGDTMVGALLDGYRLSEKLGEGGMARVYRADADHGGESVAIKVLDHSLASDTQFVRRFNREKDVYADLSHPNIVRVLGFGTFQEHHYLMMELVRGVPLRDHVKAQGMTPREMLGYLRPVFEAVHYAHGRGIVHRDLKPENIMVTDGGKVKVMDFGLAGGEGYSQVTRTGSLLGTPAYMAPEQAKGQLNVQSDQYALGILVFELLTGSPPFMDENAVNIVFKHLMEEAPRLADLRPDLARISPVVERMLTKEPDGRYANVKEALTALEAASE